MPRKMRQSGVDWIGEIPEGWDLIPLKRYGEVRNGLAVERELDSKTLGAVPVYGSGGVFKYTDKILHSGESVLFGRKGTLGKPLYVNGDFWTVDTMYYSTFHDCESGFAYYLLTAFDWEPHITKTAIPSVVASDVFALKFPFPERGEQKRIVKYLRRQCNEIDSSLVAVQKSIDDYKVLKKTFVFEAVTGKTLKGKKVVSGQDWLGDIPAAWDVRRIVNLYREVSERGDDSLPILSVSINTGVSDKELSDEEQERVFIRSEDKTKYKRVQPGDLTYNMMRAWQGAFGAVRVNGMVSPAYVVARPKVEMDSRYVEYLLRSPNATREMQRYSRGIADFRLRLYWPEFKNIRIPCPPLEEQKRIADMLDEKCGEIDAVIADKERLIADLETYKKSLIFEVVTGKREVA